ncbi:MAG: hypothetical protein Q4C04_00515 [Clostridia bacterium]|nr:hypothetical protein [Clostridia bacterium]
MKKTYEKPNAVVMGMNFEEHVASSGFGGTCSFDYYNNEATPVSSCVQGWYGDNT